MKMIKILVAVIALWAGQTQAQVFSQERNVGLVDVFTNQDVLIIPSVAGGWGAPGCESHFFVRLTPNVAGYKEMLATVLTAKAAEIPVRIDGTCGNPPFFIASRIRLQ